MMLKQGLINRSNHELILVVTAKAAKLKLYEQSLYLRAGTRFCLWI